VTPNYARLFYKWWSRLSGYRNPYEAWKRIYNLDLAKECIMRAPPTTLAIILNNH